MRLMTVVFLFAASTAHAQSTSQGTGVAGASAGAGASAAIVYNNPGRVSGTTRIETAPDVVAPSLGSGHPCMINTSVGISVIGGGASGGRGEVDYGCMMMRSANAMDNQAGRIYYASKDPDACKAWRSAGAISASSLCTAEERRAAAKAPSSGLGFKKCYIRPDGAVGISYTSGADKSAAQAACLAKLGY